MTHPDAKNVLFEMVFSQAQVLYIPFLLLRIAATIIASQAMISGNIFHRLPGNHYPYHASSAH